MSLLRALFLLLLCGLAYGTDELTCEDDPEIDLCADEPEEEQVDTPAEPTPAPTEEDVAEVPGDDSDEVTEPTCEDDPDIDLCDGEDAEEEQVDTPTPSPPAPTAPPTVATMDVVSMTVKIKNVEYADLMADETLVADFKDAVKEGVVASMSGISKSDIEVELSEGSVVAEIIVTPPEGVETSALAADITTVVDSGDVITNIVTQVQAVPQIATVTTEGAEIEGEVTVTPAVDTVPAPTPSPAPTTAPEPPEQDADASGAMGRTLLACWFAMAYVALQEWAS